MKNTSFATNSGVKKERTLSDSEKSGICKSGPFLAISTSVTEDETFEAILYSLTQIYSYRRRGSNMQGRCYCNDFKREHS